MIGTEASNLQTSRPPTSTPPHLGVTKRQPAHFSDLAPCKPSIQCPQWLKLLDFFHTNDPLIVEETSLRPFKTSHEGFFRLQSEPINSFGLPFGPKSFHSPASGKGPALVIGLPAHHLRLQNNQQDRFFRESVSPWQLSGVVPIIYLESCILPPPHSVNSDKGFFLRDSLS